MKSIAAMNNHANTAAEQCYYQIYHGDERFDELVPKFESFIQAAIDAALAEKDIKRASGCRSVEDLEEVRQTDAYKVLSAELTDDQIVFVWQSFHGGGSLCGSCWNNGPYCCYDSPLYD